MLLTVIAFIAAMVAAIVVMRGTVFLVKYLREWMRNSRPEIFARASRCPRCDQRLRAFERLRSLRGIVLGGWTCPGCGSEFDQFDSIQVAHAWNANLRDFKKRARTKELTDSIEDGRSPVQRLFDD